MQNKRRKIIALLLSAQCLLLAGCNQNKEDSKEEVNTESVTTTAVIKETNTELASLKEEINESWLNEEEFSLDDVEEEVVYYGGEAFRVVTTTITATKDSICESELFTTFVREFKPGEKFTIVKIYLKDKLIAVRESNIGSKAEDILKDIYNTSKDTITTIKESDTYNLAKEKLGDAWDKAKDSYENDVNDLKKLLKR